MEIILKKAKNIDYPKRNNEITLEKPKTIVYERNNWRIKDLNKILSEFIMIKK